MTSKVYRQIEDTEVRARGAIADILSTLDKATPENVAKAQQYIELALAAIRGEVKVDGQKKEAVA